MIPILVQFKARREKEQIMWRAKEKLRNSDIVVTEDSQQRLLELMQKEVEKIKKQGNILSSPKKVPTSPNRVPSSPRKVRTNGNSPNKTPISSVPSSPIKVPFSPKKVPTSPDRIPSSPRKSKTRGNSPVKTPNFPIRKTPSLMELDLSRKYLPIFHF